MAKEFWAIFVVGVFVVVLLLLAGQRFYRVGILRRNKIKNKTEGETNPARDFWQEGREWVYRQRYEVVSITSQEGLTLKGIYVEAEQLSDTTVVLVHGYHSRGVGLGALARYYHRERGYHVLMPDLRGHGDSDGNYIAFGWHDRLDLINWLQWLLREKKGNGTLLLHGVSMGGATVLMASGETLPPQVKGIIADCAYTSARDILAYQMKQRYGLPAFPFMNVTSLICKWRAGYYIGEASVLKQLKRSTLPILLIHGEADDFVPTAMVYRLYQEAPGEKMLLLIPEAGHAEAYWKDTALYEKTISEFLQGVAKE